MAVKGASEQGKISKEIFSKPKTSVDSNSNHKPHPSGVRPYMVGTGRAKDLIVEGRMQLTGSGPGRMHWYKSVRPDYWEQITSEIKVPHKTQKSVKVWTKRSGVRNEALDCEVYALHAAMSLKLHLLKPGHWDSLEEQLRQKQIFATTEPVQTSAQIDVDVMAEPVSKPMPVTPPAPVQPVNQPRMNNQPRRRRGGGYSATNF